MDRFTKQVFNSSGSWTCPAGVTCVLVWGMGGGASGAGATGSIGFGDGGRGGCGQTLQAVILDVVPNTTYTITIGAGGAAAASVLGNSGSATTFGSLMTWAGAPARLNVTGGDSFGIFKYRSNLAGLGNLTAYASGGQGDWLDGSNAGYPARNGLAVGPGAADITYAGGGGGMGGEGLGGAGGDGNSSGTGFPGSDALPNTGGGGGGGGGGTTGISTGGAGGSGQLIIMWVE